MSINPSTQYPGKIDTSVPADYPYGKAQNITAPGDGTGTPLEAALVNDLFGFQQALLKSAGIVPSGTPEKFGASEYLQAVIALSSGRAFKYDESGVADAYVLDVRANQQVPSAYFDGMIMEFTPGNGNTGASTVNAGALGVINLKDALGVALVEGRVSTTKTYTAVYNSTAGEARLVELYSPTEVANYTTAQNVTIHEGSVDSTSFDIDANIGGSYATVGPTGSGAVKTWSALDNVPLTAKGVIVRFHSILTGYGVVTSYRLRTTVSAKRDVADSGREVLTGESTGYTASTSISFGMRMNVTSEVIIPIDDLNRFNLIHTTGQTSETGSPTYTKNVYCLLVGWVE